MIAVHIQTCSAWPLMVMVMVKWLKGLRDEHVTQGEANEWGWLTCLFSGSRKI